MKKVVKYCTGWQPRNGCDGRSVKKIFKMTIQENFVIQGGSQEMTVMVGQ